MTKEINVDLIIKFRKTNKMSIKEFCEQSNIGTTTYYKIIHGIGVKDQTLSGIAQTMNISVGDLLKDNS